MTYRANPAVRRQWLAGVDRGLTAAAEFYTKRVRARLLKGYTTGHFAHGMRGVAGRVMYTKPYDYGGGRAVTMGTSTTDVPYEVFWELGHVNIFIGGGARATSLASKRTGSYVRVEIWRPLLTQYASHMVEIVARNMRGAGGVDVSFGEAAD